MYPLHFTVADAPRAIVALMQELMPRLLAGDAPVLRQLREQYQHASVTGIVLTGAGFFVDFSVPAQLPPIAPANLVGGDARLELSDVPNGAGCVLFVSDGYLSLFEGFTYTDPWTVDTHVLAIYDVVALDVVRRARSAG
jgi:hypothetical protein